MGKVVWTPENDRKLLIRLIEKSAKAYDTERLRDLFPGATAKAIEERIAKLKREAKALGEQDGVLLPSASTRRGLSNPSRLYTSPRSGKTALERVGHGSRSGKGKRMREAAMDDDEDIDEEKEKKRKVLMMSEWVAGGGVVGRDELGRSIVQAETTSLKGEFEAASLSSEEENLCAQDGDDE